jgi:hypothetical protein
MHTCMHPYPSSCFPCLPQSARPDGHLTVSVACMLNASTDTSIAFSSQPSRGREALCLLVCQVATVQGLFVGLRQANVQVFVADGLISVYLLPLIVNDFCGCISSSTPSAVSDWVSEGAAQHAGVPCHHRQPIKLPEVFAGASHLPPQLCSQHSCCSWDAGFCLLPCCGHVHLFNMWGCHTSLLLLQAGVASLKEKQVLQPQCLDTSYP